MFELLPGSILQFCIHLKYCKEFGFTASMQHSASSLFSSISGHLVPSPTSATTNERPVSRSCDQSGPMIACCCLPSRRLNTISGPGSDLRHSLAQIKPSSVSNIFSSRSFYFCWRGFWPSQPRCSRHNLISLIADAMTVDWVSRETGTSSECPVSINLTWNHPSLVNCQYSNIMMKQRNIFRWNPNSIWCSYLVIPYNTQLIPNKWLINWWITLRRIQSFW